ncbi:MAG: thiamine phosphate synthase [Nitrosomonas sp.]|nr:MAG: thiamine phosphate synthase [Nitrosomonas sp.]
MNSAPLTKNPPIPIRGLYAVTPELPDTDELVAKVRQALEGGAKLVQYRSKSNNRSLQSKQAESLLQLCKAYRVPLLINDYCDLALEVEADGLHLGMDDMPIFAARKRLGHDKIIGASCYNDLNLALEAEKQGADYVAFGAFFPSLTKSNTVSVSMDLIRYARQQIAIPIIGIGGIRPNTAASVIASGCDAIAVCDSLFATASVKTQAAHFARLF